LCRPAWVVASKLNTPAIAGVLLKRGKPVYIGIGTVVVIVIIVVIVLALRR
jgi:hypothetical protein